MTMNRNVNKFHTTMGELIVALSDAAFEVCAEKRDASLLVTLALKHLLGRAQRDKAPYVGTQLAAAYPGSLVVVRSAAATPTLHCSSSCSAMPKGIPPPHFVTVRKYWGSSLFLSVTI